MKLKTMVRENVGLRPPNCVRWGAFVVLCLFAGASDVCAQDGVGDAEYHPVLDPADRATLSVGYEEHWVHEDGSPAEEEQWATIADEELAGLTAAPDLEARRALLASADSEALKAALDEANARIDQLAQSIPTIHRDIRRLREQAHRDSPKAKETRAEIKRLEDELEAYAESLPEIQARREAADAIHRNMLEELRFRREIESKLEQSKPSLEP